MIKNPTEVDTWDGPNRTDVKVDSRGIAVDINKLLDITHTVEDIRWLEERGLDVTEVFNIKSGITPGHKCSGCEGWDITETYEWRIKC